MPSRIQFALKRLPLLLLATLSWLSAKVVVTPSTTTLSVGDDLSVTVAGMPEGVEPVWSNSYEFELLQSSLTEAKYRAINPGRGAISASSTEEWSTTRIQINGPEGRTVIPGARGPEPASMDYQQLKEIDSLLESYRKKLADAGLVEGFARGGADVEGKRISINGEAASRLATITGDFMKELGNRNLSLRDMQYFKDRYTIASKGGTPLFPGALAWDSSHLAAERALMAGRAVIVEQLWNETLADIMKRNPKAGIFGRINIGSWVKLQVAGLGFAADIDFSSVSTDPELNRQIRDLFDSKMQARTSLDMVKADALLTAHGQATPDVFIGEWGKTFAELDMLKRANWCLLTPQFDAEGRFTGMKSEERTGRALFVEMALRSHGTLDPVRLPELTLEHEPMLSMEMLRHGIHDVERGPYSRGQQLVKMLKYVERSYYATSEATKKTGWNPWTGNDEPMARAAARIAANKDNVAAMEAALSEVAGKDFTEENFDSLSEDLMARAKTVMHDNAVHALAFRLHDLSAIPDAGARSAALDKLWTDLNHECEEFGKQATVPETLLKTLDLVNEVREGKLSPNVLEEKSKLLQSLLAESYHLPESIISRIIPGDAWFKVRAYLGKQKNWTEQQVNATVDSFRRKHPDAAKAYDKLVKFNDFMSQSAAGISLMGAANWANNAGTVYDAYLVGTDDNEGLRNASSAMVRVGLTEWKSQLGIPYALWDSYQARSPKPAVMAVVFLYFPWIGQYDMMTGLGQRADGCVRSAEFYDALNAVFSVTDFQGEKICGFRLMQPGIFGGREIDRVDVSPPGDRAAIIKIFMDPESPFYTSANFRYWWSLVPKEGSEQFGRYEDKLRRLRGFFANNDAVFHMTTMLEKYRADPKAMPPDRYTSIRAQALDEMQTELQRVVWIAMADALEGAIKSVSAPAKEKELQKLQDDLQINEDQMGAGKSPLMRARLEIRANRSLFTGENPYAIGLIFDKHITSYTRIKAIVDEVLLNTWGLPFGVDYIAAQRNLKIVYLGGSESSTPRLTGDPGVDLPRAESSLMAHKQRAAKLRDDLSAALGRAIDPSKDKGHLKALGELAIEWELLLDGCKDRLATNGTIAQQNAIIEHGKAYLEYLKNLPVDTAVAITGPATAKVGEAFTLTAVTKGLTPAQLHDFTFDWRDPSYQQLPGKLPVLTTKAETAGQARYTITLLRKTDKGEQALSSAVHKMEILPGGLLRITLSGPPNLPLGGKTTIYSSIDGDNVPSERLRYEWSGGLGSQSYLEFNPTKPGVNALTLTAYLKTGTAEQKYAEGSISISVMDTRLQMPAEVNGTDLITVTAKIPEDIASRVSYLAWYGDAIYDDAKSAWTTGAVRTRATSVKMQFGPGALPKAGEPLRAAKVSVEMRDERDRNLHSATGEIVVKPVSFSGQASSIWKGTVNSDLVSLTRDTAKNVPVQKDFWNATMSGSVNVSWMGLGNYPADKLQEDLSSGLDANWQEIKPISFAGYNGFVKQTKRIFHRNGGGGDGGFTASTVKLEASGIATKGACALQFSYSAMGGGTWDNSDASWLDAKVQEVFGEAQGILASIAPVPGGNFTTQPYKGPALDGSDDIAPLSVSLAGPATVRFGQMGTVNATVTGGRPPCKYEWSGDHAGDGAKVTVLPTKAGEQKLVVTVTSADNQKASATQTYTVEKVTASLVGLEPPVVFGSERKISIQTNVDPKTLKVIWQSDPNVTFNPPTSTDGATTVRFDRLPEKGLKLWAQLANASDGGTIGETLQVDVKVVAPKFSISFEPAAAKIGQEVTARIAVSPAPVDPALLSFQWAEPASSARRELDHAATAIAFTPRDTKPVALLARAIVPVAADRVGEVSAKFTATGFKLAAKVVEPGTRPMIWKMGVGLVPVAKGSYAGDEQLTVEAKFEDEQPTGEIRWNWTANEGTSVSNPVSQSPQLSRHETGTASATVTAKDKNDLPLGAATVSFNVNVTADAVKRALQPNVTLKTDKQSLKTGDTVGITAEVRGGKSPYTYAWRGANPGDASPSVTLKLTAPGRTRVGVTVTDSVGKTAAASVDLDVQLSARDQARQDAEQAVARARELAKKGDFEGAQRSVEKARVSDPTTAALVTQEIAQQAKSKGKDAEQKRDFATSGKLYTVAAKLAPQDTEAVRGKNNAPIYAKNLQQVVSWQGEVGQNLQSGHLAQAGDRLAELKNLESTLPGALSAATLDLTQRYETDLAAYRADMGAVKKRVAKNLADDRLTEAKTQIEERRQKPLLPEDETWAAASLKMIADKEARQAAAATASVAVVANPPTSTAASTPPAGAETKPAVTTASPETKPMVAGTGTKQGATSVPGAATGSLAPLAGEWKVNFNNFPGTLKITSTEGTLDLGEGAEKLANLRFDPSSGAVSFTRPLPRFGAGNQQVYTGRLTRDGHAEGTFDCTISGKGFRWTIDQAGHAIAGGNAGNGTETFHGALDDNWTKLQAVGGDFDRFARFQGGLLVVDVPAGNYWGKTGLVSRRPSFTGTAAPTTVTVRMDPARTTGFCITFAPTPYQDVWLIENIWFAWIRPEGAAQADLVFVNTQNGADGRVEEKVAPAVPAELVFTFQPGRAEVRLPDGKTRSIGIRWLREGAPVFTHIFSHPPAANLPAKFALRGVEVGNDVAVPVPAPASAAKPQVIFSNWNTGGVGVGPTVPTTFAIDRPLRVTYVNSYHYNSGRGTKAGTLALRHSDGLLYGPWRVRGSVASGVPEGLWECEPGVVLKPGTYTVVDSEPATWSQNGQSGGRGFVEVRGVWSETRDITVPGNDPPRRSPGPANGR